MMEHPFEHILLSTEHTEFDQGAERVAFELVSRCDLPLYAVLPVVSNPEFEAEAPQLAAKAEKEAAQKFEALEAAASARGLDIDITVRRGVDPHLEIADEAKEQHADLIVARRRGKRGFLANLLVGEMVAKVIGHAPCSLLMVPRAGKMWTKGILAAVDSSEMAHTVVDKAAQIARICNLPLTIVSIAQHEESKARHEAIVRAHVERLGGKVTSLVRVGKPYAEIISAAESSGCDLIVVGRHGDSGVLREMLGGTAHKVVGLAQTPVLVVRP